MNKMKDTSVQAKSKAPKDKKALGNDSASFEKDLATLVLFASLNGEAKQAQSNDDEQQHHTSLVTPKKDAISANVGRALDGDGDAFSATIAKAMSCELDKLSPVLKSTQGSLTNTTLSGVGDSSKSTASQRYQPSNDVARSKEDEFEDESLILVPQDFAAENGEEAHQAWLAALKRSHQINEAHLKRMAALGINPNASLGPVGEFCDETGKIIGGIVQKGYFAPAIYDESVPDCFTVVEGEEEINRLSKLGVSYGK